MSASDHVAPPPSPRRFLPSQRHVFLADVLGASYALGQLEALFVFLVSVMTVAFFVDFGMAPPSGMDVAEGFSFRAEPYATVPALGLIGAVIMPHNLYLHSALVLSRTLDRANPRKLWEVGSAARGI